MSARGNENRISGRVNDACVVAIVGELCAVDRQTSDVWAREISPIIHLEKHTYIVKYRIQYSYGKAEYIDGQAHLSQEPTGGTPASRNRMQLSSLLTVTMVDFIYVLMCREAAVNFIIVKFAFLQSLIITCLMMF